MVTRDENHKAGETVRAAARELDYDRYLTALLAPNRARDGLMALAAFHGEIARIPLTVHEPGVGDIRLQWWRDALATPPGTATGNPVADAMLETMRAHRLPVHMLMEIIDVYERGLEAGTLTNTAAIDAYASATQGAAFSLAAQILGNLGSGASPLLRAAGQAYGRVQLLRALPALIRLGRNPFGDGDVDTIVPSLLQQARSELVQARQLATVAPATMLYAILPVALLEPYLAALEKLGPHVADERADISALTRAWRLLKASALGRI
jgi:15-cis-phytoene synthase